MLNLSAGLISNPVTTHFCSFSKLLFPDDFCQGGIGDTYALFFDKLFMNSLHTALTIIVQMVEQLRVNFDFVFSDSFWHSTLLINNRSHRVNAHIEVTGNLSKFHALLIQLVYGLAFVGCNHKNLRLL